MDTLDPKLKQFLSELPGSFKDYKDHTKQRFDKLEEAINEARFVDLTNGDGLKMKTAKVIPTMYKDIKDIKTTIAEFKQIKVETSAALDMILDFSRVHNIFKKYKMYQALLIGLAFLAGMNIWEFTIEFIKTALK